MADRGGKIWLRLLLLALPSIGKTSGFGLRIGVLQASFPKLQGPFSSFRLRFMDFGLRIVNLRLQIVRCGLPGGNLQPTFTDWRLKIADCWLKNEDSGLKIADCGMKIENCGLTGGR